MQPRPFALAVRTAAACALAGTVGCATILKGSSAAVSIDSSPASASVEVKRTDGIVVRKGRTPMTARLNKGKEYTVTIRLEGYETETVPILRSGIEPTAFCNLGGMLGWAVDYASGAMFVLEPGTIDVQLEEVTALDGGGSVLYALLTFVDEDGAPRRVPVRMTPAPAD